MRRFVERDSSRECLVLFYVAHLTECNPSTDYIRFYHLRVFDRLNAPIGGHSSFSLDHTSHVRIKGTLIAQMEEKSGVKFGQAQAALARQWVGDSADRDMPSEMTIKLPEPTSEGIVLSEKTEVKTEKYPLPVSLNEAVTMIERFEYSATALVGTRYSAVADTVGQHALQDETRLVDEQWLGSKEEELNSYVFV
jgi:phospholipase D1/2